MCAAMMAGFGGQASYGIALLSGVFAAVVLGVVVIVAMFAGRSRPVAVRAVEHPAIGLLKERLARGEIDAEEFERRLFALQMHEPLR